MLSFNTVKSRQLKRMSPETSLLLTCTPQGDCSYEANRLTGKDAFSVGQCNPGFSHHSVGPPAIRATAQVTDTAVSSVPGRASRALGGGSGVTPPPHRQWDGLS